MEIDIQDIFFAIKQREIAIEKLAQMVEIYKSQIIKPKFAKVIARELVTQGRELRLQGIRCVQRIGAWTMNRPGSENAAEPSQFLRQSDHEEYLCKMYSDLNFIAEAFKGTSFEKYGNYGVNDPMLMFNDESLDTDLGMKRQASAATLIILDAYMRNKARKEKDMKGDDEDAVSDEEEVDEDEFKPPERHVNSRSSFRADNSAASIVVGINPNINMRNRNKARGMSIGALNNPLPPMDDIPPPIGHMSGHSSSSLPHVHAPHGSSAHVHSASSSNLHGAEKKHGHGVASMLLGMLPGRVSGMFYRRKNLLGEGAYAKVYDCQRYSDAHDFAIKIFEAPQVDDDEETVEYMTSCLQREMGMMEALRHPHVVSMIDCSVGRSLPSHSSASLDTSTSFMVMEKMQSTLLEAQVDRKTRGRFTEPSPIEILATSVLKQILSALEYLQESHQIIHRDVKPENILIVRSFENKGITAKLADFGTARDLNSVHYTHENGHGGGHVLGLRSYSHDRSSSFLHRPSFGGTSGIGMNRGSSLSPSPSHHHHNASPDSRNHPNHPGISTAGDLTEYVGSRWYRAPEMLGSGTKYDYGVDIWALACTLYEFIVGRALFNGDSEQDVLDSILFYYPNVPIDFCREMNSRGLKVPLQLQLDQTNTKDVSLPPRHDQSDKKKKKQLKSIHAELGIIRIKLRNFLVKMLSLNSSERLTANILGVELDNIIMGD